MGIGNNREDFSNEERFIRAKERVDKLKGFYWHLFSYICVNLFISISKIISNMSGGESFMDAFWDFGTFALWIFWGIGIGFHAMGVFGTNLVFGRKWEERKLKEFMDEDKRERDKWE